MTDNSHRSKRYFVKEKHYDALKYFVKSVKERLSKISSAHETQPCPWAFFEVGWAINPYQRRTQHASHTNSVPLMKYISFSSSLDHGIC